MAGLFLDPWEAFVLDHALGERRDGKWAAFEVGLVVSRQNGKGAILEARELAGLFLLGEQLIIHSAHQFDTSIEAFLRMEALLEGAPDLSRRMRAPSRSHGSEGFALKNGQRLRYRTRTKGGGRGFTADCLILDEAMILPETFHGALLPTLAAKSVTGNPQVWYTGSAVDQAANDDGVVLARVRDRGLKGTDPALAYFEWSLDRDDPDRVTAADVQNVTAWAEANPGLGIRISAEHIAKELRSMGLREFIVERLGVGDWPAVDGTAGSVIGEEEWAALADPASRMVDPVCLALDVSPDRSWASIAAAGRRPDGLPHVEVIDRRRGTGWVVARAAELASNHRPASFLCDGAGPAGSLLPELQHANVEMTPVTAKEHAQGCGLIYDAVSDGTLRHLGQDELAAAVRAAVSRPLGDAWAWARKGSTVDISPLVACTLALWGVSSASRPRKPMVAFV